MKVSALMKLIALSQNGGISRELFLLCLSAYTVELSVVSLKVRDEIGLYVIPDFVSVPTGFMATFDVS